MDQERSRRPAAVDLDSGQAPPLGAEALGESDRGRIVVLDIQHDRAKAGRGHDRAHHRADGCVRQPASTCRRHEPVAELACRLVRLAVWTVASALGVASLVRTSEIVFTALKLVGAAYLIWLGAQALRSARHRWFQLELEAGERNVLGARMAFRQGLLSNLGNPKIAAFFTSLLPQFIGSGRAVLLPFLLLGGVFVLMTLGWLCAYALVAARASVVLRRPKVKAALDRLTGAVLIGARGSVGHRAPLKRPDEGALQSALDRAALPA